jgi:glycosyltransferase involved in cell wall biosynthesis
MRAAIIMPINNGTTTLKEVIDSLERQKNKEIIEEIIFLDDGSNDNSSNLIAEYQKVSSYKTKLVMHAKAIGLAATYNEGVALSKSDFFITMHQDIVLQDDDSFKKITEPFLKNEKVVAAYPTLLHPYVIWENYNFWQKVLFSRHVDTRFPKFAGKFDCIKKIDGLRYDEKTFYTAGEDFDFENKCKSFGLVESASLGVTHIHSRDKNFSFKRLEKKEMQLAECYGVNFKRYFFKTSIKDIVLLVARPLILVGLFINFFFINVLSFFALLLFVFFYTKLVYLKCYKDPRIVLLPFVNFISLTLYSIYFIKGFIWGMQRI